MIEHYIFLQSKCLALNIMNSDFCNKEIQVSLFSLFSKHKDHLERTVVRGADKTKKYEYVSLTFVKRKLKRLLKLCSFMCE